jgi:hypothetical protein
LVQAQSLEPRDLRHGNAPARPAAAHFFLMRLASRGAYKKRGLAAYAA